MHACELATEHWRKPRRGCRGHIPPIFWLGGTSTGISPPILLLTFGYSRPILVALRSLSLKPFSFGYKTPPIRFSQEGGQSAHKARPPNLQLALTPLSVGSVFQMCGAAKARLPTVDSLTGGTTRRLAFVERSVRRPGKSSTRVSGPR